MGPAAAGLLYWYTTSAVLALLTICNIVRTLAARYTRHRRPAASAVVTDEDPFTALPKRASSSKTVKSQQTLELYWLAYGGPKRESARVVPRRLARTAGVAWTKYVLLADVPLVSISGLGVKAKSMAASEAGCTLGYTAGVLALSFYGTGWDIKACANQTGWLAIAQIPLIIALAGKNNLVSLLTGMSYERLNFLHRAAGRVCLLGAWLHTIGYIYLMSGISLLQFQTALTTWGMTSILALSLIFVISFRVVRQRIYEFFLVAHVVLVALFLAGVIMHWRAVDVWIYPGIALWVGDRFLRLARMFLAPALTHIAPGRTYVDRSSGTLALLTPSTVKLTLPTNIRWQAGQHFYVLLPTLSRTLFETHPFTAATIPSPTDQAGEVSFLIRVREGVTKRMKEHVERAGVGEGEEVQVKGKVEGPYGGSVCLRGAAGVVIFAGGSGISFAVAHLLQVIADAKAGKTRCKRVEIVWMVKSKLHLSWIRPILQDALGDSPHDLHIALHIHVTHRPLVAPVALQRSALPASPSGTDNGDWQAYLEDRASRPRRTSRLMSTMSWATFAGDRGEAGGSGMGTQPGTRRGSEMRIPLSSDRRRSARGSSRGLAVDIEAAEPYRRSSEAINSLSSTAIPTFQWSEGYDESALDTTGRSDTASKPTEFGAWYTASRKLSEAVGPFDRARLQSYDSAHSSDSGGRRRPSLLPLHVPLGESDQLPHARTRTVSFADTASSPSGSRSKVSFDSSTPLMPDSPISPGLPKTPTTPKRTSPLKVVVGTTMAKGASAAEYSCYRPSFDDPLSAPIASPTALRVEVRKPSSSYINFSRPLPPASPSAGLMIPPSSAQMSRSSTTDSLYSCTSGTALLPDLPSPSPSTSRSARPSCSGSRPLSPLPLLTPLGTSSLDSPTLLGRAHRSWPRGLDGIVKWHEGRADPTGIIRRNKEALADEDDAIRVDVRLEVMVCGPASLLGAVKKAARAEMDVRDVWQGGVRVGFHAESFGW